MHICMHVLANARDDVRVMREATALTAAGYQVSVVDVVSARHGPAQETIQGILMRHIYLESWSTPSRIKIGFLFKMLYVISAAMLLLIRSRANIYHAHSDFRELPACYLASLLTRKPLVFDAHELPLSDPGLDRWSLLKRLANGLLKIMLRHCIAIITVSPPWSMSYTNAIPVPVPP
ncbi:glycosyltransferase [Dictyobacter kobayashii]|uniref:glycosyltransferase n=1 Tax=Dictyobacter kobayashii TaxID=2014872 RepID=UPI000F83A679|nr:glycosyltransferase family 4 protein [Dictyobacter kobayashii]